MAAERRGLFSRRAWLAGLLVSLAVAWAASALGLDDLLIAARDPATGLLVPPAGLVHRHPSEGGGRTVFGRHGIPALPDATRRPEGKVLFWGDSFVEGLQVDDRDKMAQAFTRLAREDGRPGALGVGLGGSGERVADYYFKMPAYERLLPHVLAHVIVISGLEDVLPDAGTDCHSHFAWPPGPTPDPGLTWSQCEPGGVARRWGGLLTRLRLQGAYALYRKARDLRPRLAPGPAAPPPPAPAADLPDPGAAWDFLLSRLRERTDLPLVFAYLPDTPCLRDGRVDTASDPSKDRTGDPAWKVAAFARACAAHHIGFVDLSGPFDAWYAATGRLPRGFPGTIPGRGHLNPDGHRLVARAVLDELTRHAVLPR